MSIPKIFFVKLSELAERMGRFDVPYWLPKFREQRLKLEKCEFELVPLSRFICSIESGAGVYDLSESAGWRYLNVNNITPMGIDDANCGFISSPPDEMATNTLRCGDVVTGRVGTIGVFCKYASDVPAYISDNVFRIRLKDCDADYILAILNSSIVQCQIEREAKGSLQRVVNKQTIRNLLIPIPPLDVQRKLVAELDAAYAEKRKADEKATRLLASIDGVVLDALGLPPLPTLDTSLSARIFTVSSRDLTGRSFAPSHYLQKLDFSSSKYKCLSFCATASVDPLELTTNAKRPYHLVPMDAVSAEYGCIERVEEVFSGDMAGYSTFRNGDVIFAKISPCMENGKSAVVSTDVEGVIFGSTEFLVFRPRKDTIMADYLHLLLRLKVLREFAGRNMSGTTGHQRVTGSFFRDLKIPVPPLSVQKEIIAKVSAIRTEARTVNSSAAKVLAEAKRQIESEIICQSVGEQ